ncbi:MAG: hypothetical protein ACJ72Z_01365 [Pyrinomonadaceae bacterium]
MKNIAFGVFALTVLAFSISCKLLSPASNSANNDRPGAGPAPSATSPLPDVSGTTAKHAYHISGTIDEASQEGNVCDTSVKFDIPGTLKFEFTPSSPTKGNYTYSGPFNASGSGPYEIHDDGSMLVDGTGCILGKCATYSHTWKAKPIDAKTCVPGK